MSKIMHFLSTGPKFPYPYYLGIMTALKVHKGRIFLWITEKPDSNYFKFLQGKVEIKQVKEKVPRFPALIGRSDHFIRCTVFDYLIWRILYCYGGIIMGLDSISLKDWQDLLPPDKEIMLPIDDDKYPNRQDKAFSYSMHGVIIRKRSPIAKAICSDSLRALNLEEPGGLIPAMGRNGIRWGGAGIIPYLNHAAKNMNKAALAEFGLVGGYKHDGSLFYLYEKNGNLLHPDTRTIPLYATSRSKSFAGIDEDFIADSGTLFSKIVKKCLSTSEWDTRARVARSEKEKRMKEWQKAQKWEKKWWGNCLNTYHEETKQLLYAEKMGLEFVPDSSTPYRIEMLGKFVLDVGGGPVSLLLKCVNVKGKIIDPLQFPSWVLERYRLAGIEFERKKAEELNEKAVYDESWIYNCLQHVESPEKIVKITRQLSKIIRVFEWIDLPKCEGHSHILKASKLDQWLGGQGAIERVKGERGCWGKCYYGIFKGEKYGK